MSTDYILPALNVDDLLTEVSGQFFQNAVLPTLTDVSHNISVDIDKAVMNQIFLFYSDDTSGNSLDDDLSDLSNTDLKYAMHTNQWNIAISTVKNTRKHVIANLLSDLFGQAAHEALANVDVFSNEEELDADITEIFNQRISATQRANILAADAAGGWGSFVHGSGVTDSNSIESVGTDTANVIYGGVDPDKRSRALLDYASKDPNAITAKLIEQAAISDRTSNSSKLNHNFGTANTSNADLGLPTGWRTFQFQPEDTVQFNVTITQPNNTEFIPSWAVANAPTPTSFRVKLTIKDGPLVPPSTNAGNFATLQKLPVAS